MAEQSLFDEPFHRVYPAMPGVRLRVEYREVGPGPEFVEIEWERDVPDAPGLAYLARVLLQARDGG